MGALDDEATQGDEDAGSALHEVDDPKAVPHTGSDDGEAGEEQQQGGDDERLAHGDEAASGEQADDDSKEGEGEEHRGKRSSKERREARKRFQQQLRAENQVLSSQVQQLMREMAELRSGRGDDRLAILDTEIKRCSDELATADNVYVAAVDAASKGQAGAAADVLAAQRFREDARARVNNLSYERQQLAERQTQARSQPPPTLPAPGSAIADQHEASFKASRPWLQFDPTGRPGNIESGVARAISTAMRAEGLDPATAEYWTQLDSRLKGALPHMHAEAEEQGDDEEEGEEDEPPPRTAPKVNGNGTQARGNKERGPPVGKSGRASGGNRSQGYIPAEVVSALKEAGMWDDPKERKEALAYYREAGVIK